MNKVIYTTDSDISIDLMDNETLEIHHYIDNKSINVVINLRGINAQVNYYLSCKNIDNNKCNITINHLNNNTISNIYNHGVNKDNKRLIFNVTGIVPKDINGGIVNQENQIINLNNGYSEINPNLLIESFNSVSNHAAYIGKFKDELIFYLMSRGISKDKCINMLILNLLLNNGNTSEPVVKDFIKDLI